MEPESSTSDNSLYLHVADVEFTLEDTYETLKDAVNELDQEIERLADEQLNNEPARLNTRDTQPNVTKKLESFARSLLNQVVTEAPKNYPIPQTSDLHTVVVAAVEDEVRVMEACLEKTKNDLKVINDSIASLENKKESLQKMKESCLAANEIVASKSYQEEVAVTNRIFKEVKLDLHEVVSIIFPNNESVRDLLADLTQAYFKGGDDVYVNILPEALEGANFLLEADLAMRHRNDKNKIRLVDLL